jgi:polyhydroxybutyrate depolymerase
MQRSKSKNNRRASDYGRKAMIQRVIFIGLLITATLMAVPAASAARDACNGSTTYQTGSAQYTFEHGGLTRIYRVFVPSGYGGTQPVPLVMPLHGAAGWAVQQEGYSEWNAIAERETFVTIHPQGALETGPGFRWNAGEPMRGDGFLFRGLAGEQPEDLPDDAAFLTDLLIHLQTELCIDPARIYVNGLSNGGGMTNYLACVLADKIAAVGTVAGAYTPIPGGCNPARPIPVITFHGKRDNIVAYDGSDRINLEPVGAWAAAWAARNGCDETPETVEGTVGAVTGVRYVNCDENAEVVFYTIADAGHTWPGAEPLFPLLLGEASQDIDASETMWAFFAEHPIPASE